MENGSEDITCMNCNVIWNRQFLVKNFGKVFMNKEYKEYRENLLFKIEEKMMKSTQPYIEKENRINECNREIRKIESERQKIHSIIYTTRREEMHKLNEQIQQLQQQTEKLIDKKNRKHYNEIEIINSRYNEVQEQLHTALSINIENYSELTNIICGNNECNGYLTEKYFCNLCNTQNCENCYEVLEQGHKCDENKLETIKYILTNLKTKQCPNCNIDINKFAGCDDAFCTNCKTKFNWKTLKIMKGNSTNEDYKSYMKTKKEQELTLIKNKEIICPSELDDNYINIIEYRLFEISLNVDESLYKYLAKIIIFVRRLIMLRDHQMRKYIDIPDRFHRTLDTRKLYMNNVISKDAFKRDIQLLDKEFSKREDIGEILLTYIESSCDVLNWFLSEFLKDQEIRVYKKCADLFQTKIENLIEYTNGYFYDLSNNYNCKIFRISGDYVFN
jgi:polyhydroxyalkanoate synthesis regulator phasin